MSTAKLHKKKLIPLWIDGHIVYVERESLQWAKEVLRKTPPDPVMEALAELILKGSVKVEDPVNKTDQTRLAVKAILNTRALLKN